MTALPKDKGEVVLGTACWHMRRGRCRHNRAMPDIVAKRNGSVFRAG